ncbi:IS200/IS605 family transposase [Brumimicrobium glaciale]|uniref:IS200/IS605 family transposase n=1 Tax=Brumimicrobium glaciale TaxID=200475 RepID=A0A4Q4KLU1_9FLAO|nr:IS200/IS605 family transposase [Brumimicrobium glaciale]RYM34038.1 IS200/IS605 family transposase [Brumimicrobium glaciale]
MGDTYSKMYYHIIFAVRNRKNHIDKSWKEDLNKYITGIVKAPKQKMMIINGMPNHLHILLSSNPNCFIPDLVRDIKSSSTKWINENHFTSKKFTWQKGYSVFTIGYSQVPMVTNYIKNQEKHHSRKTFEEEYLEFLDTCEVEYDERYVF